MAELPRACFVQSCSAINKKDFIEEYLFGFLIQQELRAEPCYGGRYV